MEDMLRSCVLEHKRNWEKQLPMAEFAYNNSFQAIIHIAPYEALYGTKCRSQLYWDEFREHKVIGPEVLQEIKDLVFTIREMIKVGQSRQKSYVDNRRSIEFEVRD